MTSHTFSSVSGSARALRGALALAALAFLLGGCQSVRAPETRTATKAAAAAELVWPPPPAPARIRYTGEIRSPLDLGIRPNWLGRLWNRVIGKATPRLVRPHGVAVDARGRLWVSDPGARRVHVFDPQGHRYRALPRKGDEPLLSPIAIAFDASGVAYVSDSALRVIRRFDADGRALADWTAQGRLVRPTGLAFDRARGLLWVVDTGAHHLLALDSSGKVTRVLGERGTEPGRFNFPTHLAIAGDGRLVVADTLNFRVQIISPSGEPLAQIGAAGDGPGAFSKPKGVALDREGHVYVVDAIFDNVQIFDQKGQLLLHFGDHGSGPAHFWLPSGIGAGADGRLYVADSYNQRVQVFEYLGE